ncbi:S53 family peptidase [Xylanimonas sp. McL0601]|uniref:S53 family peptidase n=1 Tax=Xylanimonas sp. McL0601 TaxID=3414739 RepID=UPI003CEE737B
MRRHPAVGTLIVASSLALGFAAIAPAAAAPGSHHIPQSAPGWLAHAKRVGTPSSNAAVQVRVYLAPRGGLDALAAQARAVSTPGSSEQGHFLTPAQYHAQYDPASQTISAVTDWLTGSGLKVAGQESRGRYLDVTGSVAAAQRAFGVTLVNYSHDGMTVQAPTGELSAPDAVAGDILSVSGLDTTPETTAPLTQKPSPPSAGFRNARPCSTWYGDSTPANTPTPDGTVLPQLNGATLPFAPCGYTGPQLRGAYEAGASASLLGAGVTVAITDAYASSTIESDANAYAIQTGDKPFAAGQFSQSLPNSFTRVNDGQRQCGASGWYGEETLDVEAVHAMAPAANIRYYAGASCYDRDLLDTFSRINDEATVQIVTNSWGDVGDSVRPSVLAAYEAEFLQGAVEGISYLFSSGDNGDDATVVGTPQTDYPASDPYVTAVGGTSTEITAPGVVQAETGWQTSKYSLSNGAWTLATSFQYGGGGGYSSNIAEPDYQRAAGIVSPNGGRAVPDVSMDADPTTGMLVGQTQTFPDGVKYDTYRIGGTSLASPLFAGMTALKIQASKTGLGLLNPRIYADHTGFQDVTGAGVDQGAIRVDFVDGVDAAQGYVYSIRTFNGATTSLKVGSGWDSETGWGSARAGWLAPAK